MIFYQRDWAVIVAQLEKRSLLTSQIHVLNPDFGKFLCDNWTIEKTKITKKEPGMGYIFIKIFYQKSY